MTVPIRPVREILLGGLYGHRGAGRDLSAWVEDVAAALAGDRPTRLPSSQMHSLRVSDLGVLVKLGLVRHWVNRGEFRGHYYTDMWWDVAPVEEWRAVAAAILLGGVPDDLMNLTP